MANSLNLISLNFAYFDQKEEGTTKGKTWYSAISSMINSLSSSPIRSFDLSKNFQG